MKLAGEQVTCYLFSFRLSYSGKAVHRVFASSVQEAFLEATCTPRQARADHEPFDLEVDHAVI